MSEIGIIVLAAGQGTRMKSSLPKVLHPLGGIPLFRHVLKVVDELSPTKVVVVIGHGADAVRESYQGNNVIWVVQNQQLGTGHAVLCAKDHFAKFCGDILILSGDVPLIEHFTLATLAETHRKERAA